MEVSHLDISSIAIHRTLFTWQRDAACSSRGFVAKRVPCKLGSSIEQRRKHIRFDSHVSVWANGDGTSGCTKIVARRLCAVNVAAGQHRTRARVRIRQVVTGTIPEPPTFHLIPRPARARASVSCCYALAPPSPSLTHIRNPFMTDDTEQNGKTHRGQRCA